MILMYHNVLPDDAPGGFRHQSISLSRSAFRKQMAFLKRFFNPVSLEEYLNGKPASRDVAITFDDGTSITYDTTIPIIEKLNIPITIFVATQQVDNGPLIWAAYINALCFENIYEQLEINGQLLPLGTLEEMVAAKNYLVSEATKTGDQRGFVNKLRNKYKIPEGVDRYYRGMSSKQLEKAGKHDLVTLGAHSISHPDLSRLNKQEQSEEIKGSLDLIRNLSESPVNTFAYPSGDYDQVTLEILNELGIEKSFAVKGKNLGQPDLEIERIGVFSPSILKLGLKLLKRMA